MRQKGVPPKSVTALLRRQAGTGDKILRTVTAYFVERSLGYPHVYMAVGELSDRLFFWINIDDFVKSIIKTAK